MPRPRIRAAPLATGAGLATSYASVSDFTGVIHGYYTGTGAAGLPAAGRKDAMGHRAVSPPSAGTGQTGRPRMTTLFTPVLSARCHQALAVSFWRAARRVAAGRRGGGGDD